ncbi:hypothetical protein ACMZOO_03030 [Catenovulum sp. SX2]|uniref:hypothetical protein n=1 Tax=Catenovulum sp. SX2 TaxID=3398614 RepID=UPI003F83933B
MGFKDAKAQVLSCLESGNILHEARGDIDIKNLLSTGQISIEDVTNILKRARGNQYECSSHHVINTIDVHIIKTNHQGKHWYIKWYFVEPNSVFISVHN